MNEVKSFSLNLGVVRLSILIIIVFSLISTASFYLLNYLYNERIDALIFRDENLHLRNQIDVYADEISKINMQEEYLDMLGNRVLGLATLYKSEINLENTSSTGGRELNLPSTDNKPDLYSDKALMPAIENISTALKSRASTLDELADLIEEQDLLGQSTPMGSPVTGWISSKFDFRYSPFSGKLVFHQGLDIAARYGLDVLATAKGVVVFAGNKYGYGKMITIDHGYGYLTRYAHNSRLGVKEGDIVERGDVIAKVGSTGHSTGPHVHYEILVNGIPVNPMHFLYDYQTLMSKLTSKRRINVNALDY